MQVLKRDFLPADLLPVLDQHEVSGCIAVQASQSEQETVFLHELARQHDFIKAVVGWVDLRASNVNERMAYYHGFEKIVGFRHIIQDEPDPLFMSGADFRRGIASLSEYDFSYDILIYPHQLKEAIDLVRSFPQQKFVIDHLAKPSIKTKEFDNWETLIREVALNSHVYCKLSGMVTEADWRHWEKSDFLPVIDVVVESFGVDRLMFGSDWPVCLLAASYKEVKGIVHDYFQRYDEATRNKIFGQNAIDFYNIS